MGKDENTRKQREIELLEELVKWTRATSIAQVKKILEDTLETPNEKIAYQASDGVKSQSEIASLANVDQGTVSDYGKVWIRNGIAKAVPVKGGQRAVRLFSLEEFGIEVPKEAPKMRKTSLRKGASPPSLNEPSESSAETTEPQKEGGSQ